MKIFMTGGTGFVGRTLTRRLTQDGHDVTVLTRNPGSVHPPPPNVRYLEGDPAREGAWQGRVSDHEVIINLAGTSIFSRWTKSAKLEIRNSRVLTTRHLVEALSAREGKETLFLSTSAVGYYGFHDDEELDESCPPGRDFLASVARDWESEALRAERMGARVCLLRFGVILGRGGGALKKSLPIYKRYLGSPLGSGGQWFSWIHERDLVEIYLFLMKNEAAKGAVNCVAPNPVRNRDLTKELALALGKPAFMPAVPGIVIKTLLGEFGSMLLKGQKALPVFLLRSGFHFRFPTIREALRDLLHQNPEGQIHD
ncbi:MAG: TIGR01777 family oxidoreductase [Desulfatiglandales bacterium]